MISAFLWRDSGIVGKHGQKFVAPRPDDQSRIKQYQDGFKEHLLCYDCEQQLGRYEDYAKRSVFSKSSPANDVNSRDCILTGLDYAPLKLFQMSILWRMSITNHVFYQNVKLGKHQEMIRQRLATEDPGEPWEYACIATQLSCGSDLLKGMFSPPSARKLHGHNVYEVVIAGMHWFLYASSHSPVGVAKLAFLTRTGEWVLFRGNPREFTHLIPHLNAIQRQTNQKGINVL
ncbi:MAG: hypothetical protein ABL962_17935 [Fimbriimonadaceae bacterium]